MCPGGCHFEILLCHRRTLKQVASGLNCLAVAAHYRLLVAVKDKIRMHFSVFRLLLLWRWPFYRAYSLDFWTWLLMIDLFIKQTSVEKTDSNFFCTMASCAHCSQPHTHTHNITHTHTRTTSHTHTHTITHRTSIICRRQMIDPFACENTATPSSSLHLALCPRVCLRAWCCW